jgi:hypothetical protein
MRRSMAELAASLQSAASESSPFARLLPTQECLPAASLDENAGVNINAAPDHATVLRGRRQPSSETADHRREWEIEKGAPQRDRQVLATADATQDYRLKAFELMKANVKANLEFSAKLKQLKTPFEFIELSTSHAQKQLELIMSHTTALGALSRSSTMANAERISAGIEKVFGRRKI